MSEARFACSIAEESDKSGISLNLELDQKASNKFLDLRTEVMQMNEAAASSNLTRNFEAKV